MELYRSQDMTYVRITMSVDAAQQTIYELGTHGKFHVVDLAPKDVPTKQYLFYKKKVQDCIYLSNKLKLMEDAMRRYNVPLHEEFFEPTRANFDVLEQFNTFIYPIERELSLNESFYLDNKRQMAELTERKIVLERCRYNVHSRGDREQELKQDIEMRRGDRSARFADIESPLMESKSPAERFHSDICGTIPTSSQEMFHRMIYRISRGNAYINFDEVPEKVLDPATGVEMSKSVFYIISVSQQLSARIRKACPLFQATIYDTPERLDLWDQTLRHIQEDLKDKQSIMHSTQQQIFNTLDHVSFSAGKSPLREWQNLLRQEKAICAALMKARFSSNLIVFEGWVPNVDKPELYNRMRLAVAGTGITPAVIQEQHVPMNPPTAFPTNKFTSIFQGIVDTYGVPRYKEVNPGLFTIVTFPFLFGVMYGDMGHGVFLFLFALGLILAERKLEHKARTNQLNEIFAMAYGGRYMLLLMGFFAIYCGTIYNDCMAVPVHFSDTTWKWNNATQEYDNTGDTYPYGIDPSWYHKSNMLAFQNSFKMKLAVTLGVLQMLFGLFLSLSNHLYFKDMTSVYFEFIPRLVFLLCTFGYMIAIIIYKFTVNYNHPGADPPNLIQTMIKMFLSPGTVETQLYSGQSGFQVFLVLAAVFSIPIMLCVKPCLNKRKFEKAADQAPLLGHGGEDGKVPDFHDDEKSLGVIHHGGHRAPPTMASSNDGDVLNEEDFKTPMGAGGEGGHGHDGPYSFSDDMIHQAIHTIEYILGTVSNTASYLRLWALSLAHSQLAEVFWGKIMIEYGVETGNPFMIFVTWTVWFAATAAVLLAMDNLECFLHALRLHWVEFQNKFYYADGYAFDPFNFVEHESN